MHPRRSRGLFVAIVLFAATGALRPAYATLVGNALTDRSDASDGATGVFYTNFVPMPGTGVVDSVSIYYKGNTQPFNLYQLRPTGSPNQYAVVYDSGIIGPSGTSGTVSSLALPNGAASVQAGDLFAHYGRGVPYSNQGGLNATNTPNIYYPSPAAPSAGSTITLGSAAFPLSSYPRDYASAVDFTSFTPPAAQPAAGGARFDPNAFASLGTLSLNGGTTTFNTNTLTVSGGFSGTGALGVTEGGTEVAVFTFDAVSLGSGAAVQFTGSRPVALLSKGDLAVDTSLDVSGANGTTLAGMAASALGGFAGGADRVQTTDGSNGPGRGTKGIDGNFEAGGGGGYGGVGGTGGSWANQPGQGAGLGGGIYGDPQLTDLLGGSGGAGSATDGAGFQRSSGGAGGGAIELGALGDIAIGPNGRVLANGGAGGNGNTGAGGGSGGSILLGAGGAFQNSGLVAAAGGNGGPADATAVGGGGGGGGRIALYPGSAALAAGTMVVNRGYGIHGNQGTGLDGAYGTLAIDAPRGTAMAIGNALSGRSQSGDGDSRVFYSNFVPMPGTGAVDSVEIYSQGRTETFNLYVLRPTGSPGEYSVVYDSGTIRPSGASGTVSSLALPNGATNVLPGDVFAHYGRGIPYSDAGGLNALNTPYIYYPSPGAPTQGSTITLPSAAFPQPSYRRDYASAVQFFLDATATNITPSYAFNTNYARVMINGAHNANQNGEPHNFDDGTVGGARQQYMWFDFSSMLGNIPPNTDVLSATLAWSGTVIDSTPGGPGVEARLGVFAVPDGNRGIDTIFDDNDGNDNVDFYAEHLADLVAEVVIPDPNGNQAINVAWDVTSLLRKWRANPFDPLAGQLVILNDAHPMWVSWGAGNLPTLSVVTAPIPEPSTLVLVAMGLAGYARRRRRKAGHRAS